MCGCGGGSNYVLVFMSMVKTSAHNTHCAVKSVLQALLIKVLIVIKCGPSAHCIATCLDDALYTDQFHVHCQHRTSSVHFTWLVWRQLAIHQTIKSLHACQSHIAYLSASCEYTLSQCTPCGPCVGIRQGCDGALPHTTLYSLHRRNGMHMYVIRMQIWCMSTCRCHGSSGEQP